MDSILPDSLFAGPTSGALSLPPFTVTPGAVEHESEGKESPSKVLMPYVVRKFEAEHEDGWVLQLGLFRYGTQEACVEMRDAGQASRRLRRLEHGLRLTILRSRNYGTLRLGCLKQARVASQRDDAWSNLFGAEQWDLNGGARLDVFQTLLDLGASKVARQSVIEDRGSPNRGAYAVLWEPRSWEVPLAAYMLTRVLPIWFRYEGTAVRSATA